jgi:hypothetical protein
MLTAVHVELDDDPGDLIIQIYGESGSEPRTFWVRGVVLLEQVARICLERQLDQIENGWRREEKSTEKKAA